MAKIIDADALASELSRHAAADANEQEMTAVVLRFLRTEPAPFSSTTPAGHITASAWIVREDGLVLLTHHAKLDAWFQVGGHVEPEDESIFAASLREAREESGLITLTPFSAFLFDVDVHRIPARGSMPAHWHHDLRYAFRAPVNEPLRTSSESRSLEWVTLDRAAALNPSESVLRMVRKTPGLSR